MESVKKTYGLLVFILALHYFFSYYAISIRLENLGLSKFAIISLEDISYLFGLYNYQIIFLLLFSNLLLFFWTLFFPNERDFKSSIDSVRDDLSLLGLQGKKIKKILGVITILSTIVIASIIYFLFSRLDAISRFTVFISLVLPACYILATIVIVIPQSSKQLLGYVLIALNILLGTIIINKDMKNGSYVFHEVLFEWKGKVVQSSKNYRLCFVGYKYLAMRNNLSNSTDLYPLNEISRIEYFDK